ncbi:MAG: FAD-dependent oxidoreductase [Oleiphilaceae bacterium]|nr:FAD-dependent oxidoreductase [Oleiphilaceae bacterium]
MTSQHPPAQGRRIAVVGSGIAGLTSAYLLSRHHEVTLYEANDYLGGHTHTQHVELRGRSYPVNTGFIVFNDWTYPNFIKLMEQLGVASEASDMSFSVRCENTGLEYNGTSLNSLFAQRSNILRPAFLRMVKDILRFNRATTQAVQSGELDEHISLGEYLDAEGYGRYFRQYYIVPMGAAIWSSSEEVMLNFPLAFFLRFFHNHGMLSVDERPQWRVLKNGSQSYIDPITQPFKQRIHLATPVQKIWRHDDGVTIESARGKEQFDEVILACHSDQALKMLADPSAQESAILGALPYQMNDVVLHTDTRLMPKRQLAWASWNYHIPQRANQCAMVTYNMNMLQNFHNAPETFLVTLNRSTEIDPDKVIASFRYAHPVFTLDGVAAQARHGEISGQRHTHYCGAYWLNGFHEDGVNSALRVVRDFGIEL